MEIPPPVPQPSKPNWWVRNWKWFVPTGCLTLLVLCAAFAATIAIVVFGAVKSTDVYKGAVARAKANPAVVAALGSPITEGMFVSGSSHVTGASGQSDLVIPISGPKGKASIYLKAVKSLGRWEYVDLVVEIQKTGDRIDLLDHKKPDE
jgi:Cytochrome oxidase complex assembly protein 1